MENLSSELLMAVARIVIPLIISSLATLLGALLLSARAYIIAKIGDLNYQRVLDAVRSAIMTAEANGLNGAIENIGAVKREQAIAILKRKLELLKLSEFIPEDELIELIEAAVLENLNFSKLFPDVALNAIEETPAR